MKLKLQKIIAAKIFKGSKKRVRFEPDVLGEIKEGLTRDDVRGMINPSLAWHQTRSLMRGALLKRDFVVDR